MLIWRRSSFCDSNQCVEVAMFHKASGGAGNGACVEVADCHCGVLVRDSKDPDGPVLSFSTDAWRGFLTDIASGEYDL